MKNPTKVNEYGILLWVVVFIMGVAFVVCALNPVEVYPRERADHYERHFICSMLADLGYMTAKSEVHSEEYKSSPRWDLISEALIKKEVHKRLVIEADIAGVEVSNLAYRIYSINCSARMW